MVKQLPPPAAPDVLLMPTEASGMSVVKGKVAKMTKPNGEVVGMEDDVSITLQDVYEYRPDPEALLGEESDDDSELWVLVEPRNKRIYLKCNLAYIEILR